MTATEIRSAIHAIGLRKSYGTQIVLDGIDLDVAEGTVFALLGPNGAGKTTAVQILSTLIAADGGTVQVGGHDVAREPDAVRAMIGVTGQFSALTGSSPAKRTCASWRTCGTSEGARAVDVSTSGGAIRPGRRGEEARRDLLGGHAPAARPRDDPDRAIRGSSSSTSRRPGSIRAADGSCGRPSGTSSPAA